MDGSKKLVLQSGKRVKDAEIFDTCNMKTVRS